MLLAHNAGTSSLALAMNSDTIYQWKENRLQPAFLVEGGLKHITAEALMEKKDRKRKYYHNSYCSGKWGDSRNYDLSINSTRLGIEKTADFIEAYINERIKTAQHN